MERSLHRHHSLGKSLLGCQRAKVHLHIQVPPQHIPVPSHRFSHIHMDLVGPLPASKGFTHLFIDRTSRWPEAIPIAATTTVDCANDLFQGWVSRLGVPTVISSDRGAQFTSSLWAALCSLLNIQHNQTTAYHPQFQQDGRTLPLPSQGRPPGPLRRRELG
jgi:hypothetical protein